MNFKRLSLYAFSLTCPLLIGGVQAEQGADTVQNPATINENVVMLPASAMMAISKNGKLAVITDTGRFLIQGTIYDTWQQKELTTIEDAHHAANYIPIDKADIGFADLEPLSIGTGDKAITMFSDPACAFCKEIMEEARESLPAGYRLDVITIPVLGPQSITRTREIHCAKDKAMAWQAAVSGDMKSRLEQIPERECSLDVIGKRRITAQFLGARNVPFLIRDDGLTRQGKPSEGLTAWIEQNRSN